MDDIHIDFLFSWKFCLFVYSFNHWLQNLATKYKFGCSQILPNFVHNLILKKEEEANVTL